MKKAFCLILGALLILSLSGCGSEAMPEMPVKDDTLAAEAADTEELPVSSAPQDVEAVQPGKEPEFYLEGYSGEALCSCFSELVFSSSDYSEDFGSLRVVKWTEPVCCLVSGAADEGDIASVNDFSASLEGIKGFPGFSVTVNEEEANLTVCFCSRDELMNKASADLGREESDSLLSVSYSDEGSITQATIYIRTDTLPNVRSALIQRELLRSLGLFGECLSHSDSILSPSYAFVSNPSEIDMLILAILYDSRIVCGVDGSSCMSCVHSLCE